MPSYSATNDLSQLDETVPIGTAEPVSILDDALRETRRTFKTVFKKEHNDDGTHQAGVIPAGALVDGAVTTAKLADAGVTALKLAANAVETAKIKDANVTASKLATDSVETDKIKDLNVTTAKVADKNITAVKLAGGASAGMIPITQSDGTVVYAALSGGASMTNAGVVTLNNTAALAVATLRDTKTQNTAGGTFTSGSDVVRDLTSLVDPNSITSLSSNQFVLQAGTYLLIASAPANFCNLHQARLRNITDSTDTLVGSVSASNADGIVTDSHIHGIFTLAAAKTFSIVHRCSTTCATDGLGKPLNFTTEVYTQVSIVKLA